MSIEDVTGRALGLRDALSRGETLKQMIEGGWMPVERVFEVDEELRTVLRMNEVD